MKEPFFYAAEIRESDRRFTLDDASAKHCIQVLRHRAGDALILTDGKGRRFNVVIDQADKKHCTVAVLGSSQMPVPAPRLGIGIAFTKHVSRIEWFIEKATEIGVGDIYPLLCARSERMKYQMTRLHHIMVSAMLQSQQVYLPRLHETTPFADLVTEGSRGGQKFIAYCGEDEKGLLGQQVEENRDALVLIGPEGDFTQEEINLAREDGYQPVSLGATRLRTETAGMVACVLLNAANRK